MGILDGKSIVLLGASGHLGPYIARGLIEQGANVLCVSRRAEDSRELFGLKDSNRFGEKLVFFNADFTKDGDISRTVDFALASFGEIQGWINNANASVPGGKFNYSRDNLRFEFENVISYMMATKFAYEYFESEGKAGSIVNVSSMYGKVAPTPSVYTNNENWYSTAAYGSSKAAIIQFTKYASSITASKNIRVNSVILGAFPNEVVQQDTEFVKLLTEKIPMNRLGYTSEVAGAIAYLLSDLSTYTTGSEIVVDGGWTSI